MRPSGAHGSCSRPRGGLSPKAGAPRTSARYERIVVGCVTPVGLREGRPHTTPADLGLPDVSGSIAGRAWQVLEVFRAPQFMAASLSDWITRTRDLEKARARLIHSHRHDFRITPRELRDGSRAHVQVLGTSSRGF